MNRLQACSWRLLALTKPFNFNHNEAFMILASRPERRSLVAKVQYFSFALHVQRHLEQSGQSVEH
jgi:hypothetical protein